MSDGLIVQTDQRRSQRASFESGHFLLIRLSPSFLQISLMQRPPWLVDGLESVSGKSRSTSLIRIRTYCFDKMVSGELLSVWVWMIKKTAGIPLSKAKKP